MVVNWTWVDPIFQSERERASREKKLEEIDRQQKSIYDRNNDIDKEIISKPESELTGWDKATLNLNPNLKSSRDQYQNLSSQASDLRSQISNVNSAQAYLQNSLDEQRKNANRLYDLQNLAARLSAEINWWWHQAWWLWAWAWQMAQSRAAIDNQAFAQTVQNEQNRASALANIWQQEMTVPTTISSLNLNNANIRWIESQANANDAQAEYYRKQASRTYSWWWSNSNKDENPTRYKYVQELISSWNVDEAKRISEANWYDLTDNWKWWYSFTEHKEETTENPEWTETPNTEEEKK